MINKRTPIVKLRKATNKSDYSYIQCLWANALTMKEVGGPVQVSIMEIENWLSEEYLSTNQSGMYYLIENHEKQLVGEISFHSYQADECHASFNIKIEHCHRNLGYGKEAMIDFFNEFFNVKGGYKMLDDIRKDNTLGLNQLKKFGFEEKCSDEEVTYLELSKETYNKRYRKC